MCCRGTYWLLVNSLTHFPRLGHYIPEAGFHICFQWMTFTMSIAIHFCSLLRALQEASLPSNVLPAPPTSYLSQTCCMTLRNNIFFVQNQVKRQNSMWSDHQFLFFQKNLQLFSLNSPQTESQFEHPRDCNWLTFSTGAQCLNSDLELVYPLYFKNTYLSPGVFVIFYSFEPYPGGKTDHKK